MSDGIPILQQTQIITGLFRISSYYLGQAVGVKPKLDQLGKPWPEILPVNLTILEN